MVRPPDALRLVAHRGCAARAPENTVAAVRSAAPHVDAVEVDVRRCGSGELVVFHDETLGRLTAATGRVADTPWSRLRTLHVGGATAPETTVPRLADVVDALPAGVALNVECKERGLAAAVEWTTATHDAEVFVSAFDPGALAETSLPRALLFADDFAAALERATELDCAYLHPQYELVVDAPERVERAHAAGFEVNVWTPPASMLDHLAAVGVDGVIVDDWAVDTRAGRDDGGDDAADDAETDAVGGSS